MPETSSHEVTLLLNRIARDSGRSSDELVPLLYAELRRLAQGRMACEKPEHTLQATALVHEAYLRLVGDEDVEWESRGHFFAAAAEAMRRILIESARRKARLRHGGDQQRVSLEDADAGNVPRAEDVLELDDALGRLEAQDPMMARAVKLRYFAGLTIEETAQALGTSRRTINRQWAAAKAWLYREMAGGSDDE
jgi:RNA polymerase sigma factor (TIGR02999 family)